MSEAKTIPAKYIFLDVVGFTHGRSVEAQADIVDALNKIVKSCIESAEISGASYILLPTGDGICIALLNIESPFDVHMKIALDILARINEYNNTMQDETRKFQVRIGINANTDNLITDINGNMNIAGAGINGAQRIMSLADGGQVLVGQSVFETLIHRESYMKSFRKYRATIKYGAELSLYQYKKNGCNGLNIDEPALLKAKVKTEPKLTKLAAYYFAHAIRNREYLLKRLGPKFHDAPEADIIVLYMLANDSVLQSEATEVSPFNPRVELSFEEQMKKIASCDFWANIYHSALIVKQELRLFSEYFEEYDQRFIGVEGVRKLERERPDIWEQFELDKYVKS